MKRRKNYSIGTKLNVNVKYVRYLRKKCIAFLSARSTNIYKILIDIFKNIFLFFTLEWHQLILLISKYMSQLKSSYTIATLFDTIFKELRFLHVKFSSCRAEGTIMISSSKIRDCFWAALFFLPRVYHSWIFVSMNLIKDASKDLGLPHCTLSFKCDLCS